MSARRRRELPDTKVVPFPDNYRGDDSPAAHRQTWGPNHDIPPLRAGEVVMVNSGNLIAMFTLRVPLCREHGYYIRGCRFVRWGAGQRVFLPNTKKVVITVTAPDADGERTLVGVKPDYTDIFFFDSNLGQKAFEEAALRAVRHAVDRHRSDQLERSDDGGANANEPPF
jgi:hypothetical protein